MRSVPWYTTTKTNKTSMGNALQQQPSTLEEEEEVDIWKDPQPCEEDIERENEQHKRISEAFNKLTSGFMDLMDIMSEQQKQSNDSYDTLLEYSKMLERKIMSLEETVAEKQKRNESLFSQLQLQHNQQQKCTQQQQLQEYCSEQQYPCTSSALFIEPYRGELLCKSQPTNKDSIDLSVPTNSLPPQQQQLQQQLLQRDQPSKYNPTYATPDTPASPSTSISNNEDPQLKYNGTDTAVPSPQLTSFDTSTAVTAKEEEEEESNLEKQVIEIMKNDNDEQQSRGIAEKKQKQKQKKLAIVLICQNRNLSRDFKEKIVPLFGSALRNAQIECEVVHFDLVNVLQVVTSLQTQDIDSNTVLIFYDADTSSSRDVGINHNLFNPSIQFLKNNSALHPLIDSIQKVILLRMKWCKNVTELYTTRNNFLNVVEGYVPQNTLVEQIGLLGDSGRYSMTNEDAGLRTIVNMLRSIQ